MKNSKKRIPIAGTVLTLVILAIVVTVIIQCFTNLKKVGNKGFLIKNSSARSKFIRFSVDVAKNGASVVEIQ